MQESAAGARAALEAFIAAGNTSDLEAVRATLHYPHVTFTPAGEAIIVTTPEEFTADFARLRASEGWHHSALDRWEILGESPRLVQLAVDVTRHHEEGAVYASGRLLYFMTERDGRWGMQLRTPLDAGGLTSGR